MSKRLKVVVIGCGGLGSAALYWLARELGDQVSGLEQFALGHDFGGSQDHSRIIRLAQHQLAYAALAPAAYRAWHEVQRVSSQTLVFKTGGLVIEDPTERDADKVGKRNINGYVEAFEKFNVDYTTLDADGLMARWPQFRLQGHEKALFQKDTGFVDAARANATHTALARAHGAQIHEHTTVRSLRPQGRGVEIVTDEAKLWADRVVLAGGAWTNNLTAPLGVSVPLTVTQEQVTYYATPNLADFSPARFPVFMWHGRHNFYGFPIYGEVATKLGQHMGGPAVTPDNRSFEPDPVRQARYRAFLESRLPGFLGPERYSKTCLYTVPPDQHFVIDTLPDYPQIALAIGAGHAFKFASLIGRILADLAVYGATGYPIDAFTVDRTALTDPDFPKAFHQ